MRVLILVTIALLAAVGVVAQAQEPSLTPELMDVAPVALEIPADRGADAVRVDIEPDGSGGRMAADASDPGGVWAWITGNPIKSTLITAGTTYLVVQGSRGKLESDMHGLGRALGLSEHDDESDDAAQKPKDGKSGGEGNTATAPPGGTAVNVKAEAKDQGTVNINITIGDGNNNGAPAEEAPVE
jgi:hypothetical protein